VFTRMSLRTRRLLMAVAALLGLTLVASCTSSSQDKLLRSDMPIIGMDGSVRYGITATPDGSSETNQAVLTGMNGESPMPLTTTFGKGAGSTTQLVQATGPDGTAKNVLSMTKQTITFGLTNYLKADVATYEMKDAKSARVCGAKVRLNFQPNAIQMFHDHRGYDALWYYSIPCSKDDPLQKLDIAKGKLIGVVLNQQTTPRITGKPIFFNRGHSVTAVGGKLESLRPGWWMNNAKKGSNQSILGAADMTMDMVKDLDKSPQPWLSFNPSGSFATSGTGLVYSAGDADVYKSFKRIFLKRQSDYIVHFRGAVTDPWRSIVIHPEYNKEWNDFAQNFKAIKDFNPLKVDEKINKDGFPKDPNDGVLKEIERSGCQNCSNAELEQVQWRDGDTGKILYANTLRAYIGAESTLTMFGKVPNSGLKSLQQQAENSRKDEGVTQCPVRYNDKGEKADDQLSQKQCADLLREGAMWNLITENPDSLGLDMVGQFRVRDNSTWASVCTGEGKDTSCSLVAQNRKLDASYLFNQTDTSKPWNVLQTLGEVGMRMLGYSYVSGPGTGSGLDFAMAQAVVRQQYQNGITNPETIFALDARALQLPQTLKQATQALYGPAA